MPVCCALPSFLPSEVTDVWMDYGLGCAFWVLGFGFWVLVTAVGWGGWLGWLVGSPITAEKQAVTSKSHNRQVGVLGALSVSWTTTVSTTSTTHKHPLTDAGRSLVGLVGGCEGAQSIEKGYSLFCARSRQRWGVEDVAQMHRRIIHCGCDAIAPSTPTAAYFIAIARFKLRADTDAGAGTVGVMCVCVCILGGFCSFMYHSE